MQYWNEASSLTAGNKSTVPVYNRSCEAPIAFTYTGTS